VTGETSRLGRFDGGNLQKTVQSMEGLSPKRERARNKWIDLYIIVETNIYYRQLHFIACQSTTHPPHRIVYLIQTVTHHPPSPLPPPHRFPLVSSLVSFLQVSLM